MRRERDPPARQEAPVERVLLVEHLPGGERLESGPAGAGAVGGRGRVRQRGEDGPRQRRGILGRDEEPVDAVADDVGHAAHRGRHERGPDRERLEDDPRQPLAERAVHGDVGRGEQVRRVLAEAEEGDPRRDPGLGGGLLGRRP